MAPLRGMDSAGVQALAERLIGDPVKNANLLPPLLAAVQPAETLGQHTIQAVRALELFFADAWHRLQADEAAGSSLAAAATASPEAVHQQWIQRQRVLFSERLLASLSVAEAQLQVAAVNALMDAARCSSPGTLHEPLLARLLRTLLFAPALEAGLSHFHAHYLQYPDIRYHILRVIARICSGPSQPAEAAKAPIPITGRETKKAALAQQEQKQAGSKKRSRKAAGLEDAQQAMDAEVVYSTFDLLSAVSTQQPDRAAGKTAQDLLMEALQGSDGQLNDDTSTQDKGKGKWSNSKHVRIAFSHAWMSFLRLPLPPALLHKVLDMLHDRVLPHMSDPLLLSEFLTGAVNQGGAIAMLALHSLFLLMTKHGLEYPDFFRKLYSLLTPSNFRAKQRVRFFELADACLASGMVPAYTAAAFIKRFARLALSAPPAGAQVCIAMVHNLLRRHPSCLVLLDRPAADSSLKAQANGAAHEISLAHDPFDDKQPDPAASHALDSSLWEVQTLQNHYCPQVAAMVPGFEKDLRDKKKTAEIAVTPLAVASYHSLATGMLGQRLKHAPTAFYADPPTQLFGCESSAAFAGWRFDSRK